MQINDKLIVYLEDLSCLTLSDDERVRLKDDLGRILSHMARLDTLDTENTPERSHPFDNVNAFRDDEAKPSFARGLLLQNAPVHNGETIVAPKTVE